MNRIVVLTGGGHGIGKAIKESFEREGDVVYSIDKQANDCFVGDVTSKDDLDAFVKKILTEQGNIDILIHNAPPQMIGLEEGSYEEFMDALAQGPGAAFYLAQKFSPFFKESASIVLITSTRARMSQKQTESYCAAKGALLSLTHALAMSLAGRVRVNAIAPGWIETGEAIHEDADRLQQPVGRVGIPEDIAAAVLYLTSEKASFITGQEWTIDGGMTKQMIYHNDEGWEYHSKKSSE